MLMTTIENPYTVAVSNDLHTVQCSNFTAYRLVSYVFIHTNEHKYPIKYELTPILVHVLWKLITVLFLHTIHMEVIILQSINSNLNQILYS